MVSGCEPRTTASAESGKGIKSRRFRILPQFDVVDFGGRLFLLFPAEQRADYARASSEKFSDELVILPTMEATSKVAVVRFLHEAGNVAVAVHGGRD